MHLRKKLGLAVTTAALVAAPVLAPSQVAAATATKPPAASAYCQSPVDLTYPATGQAIVKRFAVGWHEDEKPAYDRVVIRLNQRAANYRVRYVPRIIQDGSGRPITLKGEADLEVRIDGAAAHRENGKPTLSERNYYRNWRSLRQARLVSDFEGAVVFGIGLRERVAFRAFTLSQPERLVIDLAMPGKHPWDCRSGAVKVYFFNQPRYIANTEPFYTPVWRRVATPAVANGALASMFHGPTPSEYQHGLRFISSEATGFDRLSIRHGIARLHLTGDCSSGGSTETIAGEIFPTLKQFPGVRFVKIYDRMGQTASPYGPVDSISECLEP